MTQIYTISRKEILHTEENVKLEYLNNIEISYKFIIFYSKNLAPGSRGHPFSHFFLESPQILARSYGAAFTYNPIMTTDYDQW